MRVSHSFSAPIGPFLGGLVVLLLSLTGCESSLSVDPPDHAPQLVVNGFFVNGERWVVTASQSVGAFENVNPDDPRFTVNDATITVTPAGGMPVTLALTDTLTAPYIFGETRRRVGPAYVAFAPTPQVEETYTLRAEAPGLPAVEAQSTVPSFPPVDVSSTARRVPRGGVDPGFVRQERTVTLRIDDPPEQANRYWIRTVFVDSVYIDSVDTYRVLQQPVSFVTRNPSVRDEAYDALNDDGAYEGDTAHFSDALFDGTTHDLDLTFEEFFSTERQRNRRSYVVVEMATLSPALYDYLTSVRRYDESSDNPFAEPVNVHSNVEPGYGIFAGRHERRLAVRIGLVEEGS